MYVRPDIYNKDSVNRKGFYSMFFQAAAAGTTLQFLEFSGAWAVVIGITASLRFQHCTK